jgi:hypothetical protein
VGVSTAALAPWYANVWFWRPQVALFVSEPTLLPVLLPLAPAATVLARFRRVLAATLHAHAIDELFIAHELSVMEEAQLARTTSRSVLGIMNEFAFLAAANGHPPRLLELSVDLARTPCGPLYQGHISPDRELAALVQSRR